MFVSSKEQFPLDSWWVQVGVEEYLERTPEILALQDKLYGLEILHLHFEYVRPESVEQYSLQMLSM